ncbi:MAG TPA: hypothetical protein VJ464_15920 [Blastocatellia bacterium]|nr:hypothetical protein [Blastocatellia bacterium]
MIKRSVAAIAASLLCAALVSSACDANQVQKVKNASARIERATGAVIQLLPAFRDEGLFDTGEEAKIAEGLNGVKLALSQFNQRAASYKTFDATAKVDLSKALADVTAALAVLNEQGVLHIKNPKVKGRVQMAFVAANLAAQEIADALNQE